jgi:hypothetical protein
MKKTLSILIIIFTVILVVSAITVKVSERFIISKVASLSRNLVSVGSVSFSLPISVKLKRVYISSSFVPVLMKELNIRPAFTRRAFAFSGPGGITIKEQKRDVKVKGSVSGNFKDGELNINPTSVSIEQLGSFDVKGLLEKWGKEGVSLNIDLQGTEIKEINNLLGLNIPFGGKVNGTVLLDFVQSDPAKKNITFDVIIKELSMEEGSEFTAFVKGVYKVSDVRVDISDGKLVNSSGGQILFKGTVDRENFNFRFESENMPLEEFLKLIPEKIRKKYNISVNDGSVSMKDFSIMKIKKKSC